MRKTIMSDNPQSPESISEELRKLGDNLKNTLNALWQSEERQNITQNVEQGISDLGKAIDNLANEVTKGETSQRLKQDFNDLRTRVNNGELETQVRSEMVSSLHRVNEELNKFSTRWSPKADSGAAQGAQSDQPESERSQGDPDKGV
jgi:hypothetical protein